VVITAHQGFFTREALRGIAETTLANVSAFERGERSGNEIVPRA
jgi:D-lactate dehydrogenase